MLDGRLVPAGDAALPIDDPAVRWGEGLFETMLADGGRVPLLDRHLDRLLASFTALDLGRPPPRSSLEESVALAVEALSPQPLRVRLTVTPAAVLVEAAPLGSAPARLSALSVRGAWLPGNRMAEHKSLSYAGYRWAARRAAAAGADVALLLDGDGRLGEADVGSVFAVVDDALVTAPARGLLPGVARRVILDRVPVHEDVLAEREWRRAQELVMTNAVRGAVPIVRVDGAPVGAGDPGPVAALLAETLHMLVADRPRGG